MCWHCQKDISIYFQLAKNYINHFYTIKLLNWLADNMFPLQQMFLTPAAILCLKKIKCSQFSVDLPTLPLLVPISRPMPFWETSHFANESISRLPYPINKKFWTVEANASQTFDYHLIEADVEHWFRQFYVPEMAGTLGHVSSTSLATRETVDRPLPRIHQTTKLRPSAFHRFGVLDAAFSRNRHLFLLK